MRTVLAVLVVAMALASCGKKPGSLQPEETDRAVTFPRTYPTR
jgi:hypothetical protein